jgi:hypothetical protein
MKPITMTGITTTRRAALAAGCARTVAQFDNRNSRAECDKAHRRFLAQLRRVAEKGGR